MPDTILALLIGYGLDLILGDPKWLYHPVQMIGKVISFIERKLRANENNLRKKAVILTIITVFITAGTTAVLIFLTGIISRWLKLLCMALLDWMGIAVKSMAQEANGVKDALGEGLEKGRTQVARIVGRDTQTLDEEEIVKATVETVAENTTDGVISPMIYGAIGTPVLMWAFKAASTLDSMVGYMDDKYRDIGWSSAKLDDILNYIPARITAFLMCIAAALTGLDAKNALRIVIRDHANHLSPNCAWSEAAAAGSLHIQLGGTHTYFGKAIYKPTIGDDDRPATPEDIDKVNKLLYMTSLIAICIIAMLGVIK